MIRHENRLLVLIGDHEIGDVVTRVFTLLWADYQEGLMHEVRVSDTDIRYLSIPMTWFMCKEKRRTNIKSILFK